MRYDAHTDNANSNVFPLQGMTCGTAYKVTGTLALTYLKNRECTLGGYITKVLPFYPLIAMDDTTGEPFETLVYIATAHNEFWIGDKPLEQLAEQIVRSRGPSGYNVEYLIRLCTYMREEFPNIDDEHLFRLESLCRQIARRKGLNLEHMMGPPVPKIVQTPRQNRTSEPRTFAFTLRVSRPKLRCLNI